MMAMAYENIVHDAVAFAAARRRTSRTARWALGIAYGIVAVSCIGAAKAGTLTLEDTIREALRSDNIAIQVQDENVNGAAAKLQQAAGAFDWNVSAQGGWQLLYIPKSANGILTDQTSAVGSYYYSASIGRQFRNGIEIDPGFTAYPGAGASPAQTAGLTQTRPSLGLKIPVLRGLGEESADAAERAAADALSGSHLSRSFAIAQFAQTVVQTFWRCLADDRIAQISEDTDRDGSNYGETLQKMASRGLLEPTVAQQWSATNSYRHINAQKAQDAVQLCRRDLAYATTGSSNGPFPVPSGELPKIEALTDAVDGLNAGALIQLALDNRRDLQAVQQNVDAAAENLRSARDSTSPELNLHIEPDRAIVSYTQSIQNNVGEGQEAAAAAAKSQAELALRQLQDQIRNDVADAVRNLQRAGSDWTTLSAAEQQMEIVVGEANRRARYGSISWFDFLHAQDQLVQLQRQVVDARLQFAFGLAALRFATGTIELDGGTPARLAADFETLPTR
jgi:outer membrane protein TolC